MVSADDITVSITTFRRPRELGNTLATVGDRAPIQVIINGGRPSDYSSVITDYNGRVSFIINPRNRGVASSWNQGIVASSTRYVVLSGDDLAYADCWLDGLLAALNAPEPPLQVGLSEPTRMSAFCIDKRLVTQQGWFDQNFTQVYYEDEDWYLRTMERLGVHNDPEAYLALIPRLGNVKRNDHRTAPWNSIPNRMYFWSKWQRLKERTATSYAIRPSIVVRRRLGEPNWPSLAQIATRYEAGDYGPGAYEYDPPRLTMRVVTKATTNSFFIGMRRTVQKVVNKERKLR